MRQQVIYQHSVMTLDVNGGKLLDRLGSDVARYEIIRCSCVERLAVGARYGRLGTGGGV